jgi:hypothetical protein
MSGMTAADMKAAMGSETFTMRMRNTSKSELISKAQPDAPKNLRKVGRSAPDDLKVQK